MSDLSLTVNQLIAEHLPEEPLFMALPIVQQQTLIGLFIEEEACIGAIKEVFDALPPNYLRLAMAGMAALGCDTYDFQKMVSNAEIGYFADDIQGYIDDAFRDYRESNGLIELGFEEDEFCAEPRSA